MNLYLALLAGYSAFLILLASRVSRGVSGAAHFFVANRGLGPGLLFATFVAANIGAGSTVGATGLGYAYGLSAWWWVGAAAIGSFVLANGVGPQIYAIATEHNLLTVGDFLEWRYSRLVRTLVAITLWLGALAILAGQFIALAWILNVVAGVSKPVGCLIAGIVVTIYFSMGGLVSAVWVNLVQATVKIAGFVIAVPTAIHALGGWEAARAQAIANLPAATAPADYLSLTGMGFSWIFGYLVILAPSFMISPGLVQKAYGARDARTVRLAINAQAGFLLLYAFLPALLGITAAAAFPNISRELALPRVFTTLLPGWLGALALAAVFSAEMSAADAVLFMLATSWSKDLYKTYVAPGADDRALLQAGRWAAYLGGGAAVVLGTLLPTVVDALTLFYGILTATLFVPLFVGLYSRAPAPRAAAASIIVATTSLVVLQLGVAAPIRQRLSSFFVATVLSFITMMIGMRLERRTRSQA